MNHRPPKWINKFLEWYCRPEILEEIQGDATELFERRARENRTRASVLFGWDVIRFFRLKNIRKPGRRSPSATNTFDMMRNTLLIAMRNFTRQPGHASLNIAALAAGFTCAILIFLWVSQESSYDRFHPSPEKIFKIISHAKANGNYQTYDAARSATDVSSIPQIDLKAVVSTGTRWPHELCFRPDRTPAACVYLKGVYSDSSFFRMFNFPIVSGNRDPLTKPDQIAISENMARQLYGSDDPIGKLIKIDERHEVTVTSVFENPPVDSSIQFDFVMPFTILSKEWGISGNEMESHFFNVYLKVNSDISAADLTASLNDPRVLTDKLRSDNISYEAFPFTRWRLHSGFEDGKNTGGRIEYVHLFIVIAILIVLMAIINFVNMTTARSSTRTKEIGIRKVIGAFRSGIAIQFMTESFLTCLLAFLFACCLTVVVLPWFNSLLPTPVMLRPYSGMLPVYLSGFLLFVAMLAGIYPAFILSSFQPAAILKGSGTGKTTGSNRLRKSLLVIQLAVSLGIVMFGGVIYWQLKFIDSKDLGFDRQNMIHIEPTYRLLTKIDAFRHELQQQGFITDLTTATGNPLNPGGANTGVSWPGKPDNVRVAMTTIGCSYEFAKTFGLQIQKGRDFLPSVIDSLNTEALVTQEAVRTMGLKDPVGTRIEIGATSCIIIGVVNDFHTGTLHAERLPVILFRNPVTQNSGLYLRYEPGKPQEALAALQAAYKRIEPAYTMKYSFQDDTFNELYKTERTASKLIIVFTLITLLIALIGILGLATYNILRRSKEIGIRRAFGATVAEVLSLLTREFSLVIIIASALAIPVVGYAAKQWMKGFAYHAPMPWWWCALSVAGIATLTIAIICLQAIGTVARSAADALRSE